MPLSRFAIFNSMRYRVALLSYWNPLCVLPVVQVDDNNYSNRLTNSITHVDLHSVIQEGPAVPTLTQGDLTC